MAHTKLAKRRCLGDQTENVPEQDCAASGECVTKEAIRETMIQATACKCGIGKTICARIMSVTSVFTSVPGVSLCSHSKAPGAIAEVGDGWGRRGRHHKPCPMLSMLCVLSCLKGS